MIFAWMLTLPGAGLVGGAAAMLADHGVGGVIALLVLLAVACSVIWALSRPNKISRHNVTESREVLILASPPQTEYVNDPRGDAVTNPKQKKNKNKKHKAKSAV
jgi:PiT family inorganic phosphate transporter